MASPRHGAGACLMRFFLDLMRPWLGLVPFWPGLMPLGLGRSLPYI